MIRIDVRSPEGNTIAALAVATRLLKSVGAPQSDIDSMQRAVFAAPNAKAAQAAIETATQGSVVFVDSNAG